MPARHEPLELPLLARVLGGLKALDAERGRAAAGPWPGSVPHGRDRKADLAAWPLFAGLGPLGALPSAPRLVRVFSRLVLGIWGLAALQEDTGLLMSELATNVIVAATGPDGRPRYDGSPGSLHLLWARLLSDHERLRLEIWDTIPEEFGVPVQRKAGVTDESGRGLELLGALSSGWGWEPVPGRAVKRVWADLPASACQEAGRTA